MTARGKLPLVVGGTGLYITSLLSGIGFTRKKWIPPSAPDYRPRADTEGGAALYAELQAIDPDYAAQVHHNNPPRVIRALELYRCHRPPMSAAPRGQARRRKTLPCALSLPDLPGPRGALQPH